MVLIVLNCDFISSSDYAEEVVMSTTIGSLTTSIEH